MKNDFKVIGKSLIRVDAEDKIRGIAEYVDDMKLNNMVYAKMVMAKVPHALIRRIDYSDASKVKGFLAAVTAKDIPGENQVGLIVKDQPLLADDKIRFAGDCVCIIVAESKDAAQEAAKFVKIDYEELVPILSVNDVYDIKNLKEKPQKVLIHSKGNIIDHSRVIKGDVEKGFREADFILEREFETGYQEHAYIETQGMIADVKANGEVNIFGSMQCPFYVQQAVSAVLGTPLSKVRVVQKLTGGGFGGKEDVPSEYAGMAALSSYIVKRPVKLILDRREDIQRSSKRHPMSLFYRYGFKKDGKLVACDTRFLVDGGAYTTLTTITMFRATVQAIGPYEVENVRVNNIGIYTNKVPCGAYRGFGSLPVTLASEIMMDEAAEALGISPLTLRKINALKLGSKSITGQIMKKPVQYLNLLKEVSKEYKRLKKLSREYSKKKKDKYYGVGFATSLYGVSLGADGWPIDSSSAIVNIREDGTVEVAVGGTELGQGMRTVIGQMVAEVLGISFKDVNVLETDTRAIRNSGPTVASRTTICSGNAACKAALEVKERIMKFLVSNDNIKRSDIRFYGDIVRIKDKEYSFKEIIKRVHYSNINLAAEGFYRTPERKVDKATGLGDAYCTYSFFGDIAIIEIDKYTYEAKVVDIVAIHEIGKAINPMLVEGQIEGGVLQGVGYALYEDLQLKNGVIMTDNFSTYVIPSCADIPNIKVKILENPWKEGPFGAKGIGEPPVIAVAPAIANAIYDALGKRLYKLPIRPENLLKVMEKRYVS